MDRSRSHPRHGWVCKECTKEREHFNALCEENATGFTSWKDREEKWAAARQREESGEDPRPDTCPHCVEPSAEHLHPLWGWACAMCAEKRQAYYYGSRRGHPRTLRHESDIMTYEEAQEKRHTWAMKRSLEERAEDPYSDMDPAVRERVQMEMLLKKAARDAARRDADAQLAVDRLQWHLNFVSEHLDRCIIKWESADPQLRAEAQAGCSYVAAQLLVRMAALVDLVQGNT